MFQDLVVYLVVALAVLYVVRKFRRRRPPRRNDRKPDVPLSSLTRRKRK